MRKTVLYILLLISTTTHSAEQTFGSELARALEFITNNAAYDARKSLAFGTNALQADYTKCLKRVPKTSLPPAEWQICETWFLGTIQQVISILQHTDAYAGYTILGSSGSTPPCREANYSRHISLTRNDATVIVRYTEVNKCDATVLRKALQRERDRGQVNLIVLDLRDNPGGDADGAYTVADLFVSEGTLGTLAHIDHKKDRTFRADKNGDWLETVPLAAVTNRHTASAAEVILAALEGNHRLAVHVSSNDESTFGKGVFQRYSIFENLRIRVTAGWVYGPNGLSYHQIGLAPTHACNDVVFGTILASACTILHENSISASAK